MELKDYIKDVREDERFNILKNIEDLTKNAAEENKHIIFHNVYHLVKLALTFTYCNKYGTHIF